MQHGVAVGEKYDVPGGTTKPKIRYTGDAGGTPWHEDVNILGTVAQLDGRDLREVEWSTGSEFWAVGEKGLILKSTNNGQVWRVVIPEPNFDSVYLEGVSFATITNGTIGLFVGRRPSSGTGVAYRYRDLSGMVTWTEVTLPAGVSQLTDVDIDRAANPLVAWLVGEKNSGTEGIVLRSTLVGNDFITFTDEGGGPLVFPRCTVGEDLTDPVLNEVDVAPNGDVWVAGMCGRVWMRPPPPATVWTQVKSQTSAHISGMSFVPYQASYFGYLAGLRGDDTNQCIVRVKP